MKPEDTLLRFLFDNAPVRGGLVRLDNAWRDLLALRNYPTPLQTLLGEMIAAVHLMAANLKFDGTLILQIQGQGLLTLAVAECHQDRSFRATARWDESALYDGLSLQDILGQDAQCVITLEPRLPEGQTWQGIVALEGNSIAQVLENYMQRSEQLATRFILASHHQTAAGLLLQKLPEEGSIEDWERIALLSQTLQAAELLNLSAQAILHRLFHDEAVRIFEPEAISFVCNCSKQRVENMLALLGVQGQ